MKERVIPFAEKMGAVFFDESNPIAAPYFTKEVIDEFNGLKAVHLNGIIPDHILVTTKYFKANTQFILDLKKMGYTFIDLGGGSGSVFYDMEIDKIFN